MKILSTVKQKALKYIYIFLSKVRFLSSFYYATGSNRFSDEHFAIISGISRNLKDLDNLGNFRRNIHRIEKGLITIPAKPVFAETYIIETVQALKKHIQNPVDNSTINWANDILQQYFNTVEETVTIIQAKEEFGQIIPSINADLPVTYLSCDRESANISCDDFLELNKTRRSVRYYENISVPRNLIEKAITVALQSPSACNRQPFTFRIIDDEKIINEAALLPMGAKSFYKNIKMMIFIIGDLSNYFSERDKHLIYIDGSLAAMNFILSLETMGLSSCIINWSDIASNNKKLRKFLNLENWERCVMAISVGYAMPNGGIPSSFKKDIHSVIKYN